MKESKASTSEAKDPASQGSTHLSSTVGTDPVPLPTAVLEKLVIPGYDIIDQLGRGGMGVVYKAMQTQLGRVVALKMMRAGVWAGDEERARFRGEAQAVARLQHPNIVQIHEVGETNGQPFFSLEFVNGGSLANRLAGQPLPARQAAQLVEVLARAVHYAHQRGVVHRDLKPANILLARNDECRMMNDEFKKAQPDSAVHHSSFIVHHSPKIADFGLAKHVDADNSQTQTGQVLGTPSYMAPEQARGKGKASIGPATDIYALGAILYELLTGRAPFRGATPVDTLQQVIAEEPVPPSRLQSKVPRDLETICLKCLQKEPSRRYTTAAALADDLECFAGNRPIQARPVTRRERCWRWCRRNPSVAALTAGLVVAFVLGIGGIVWQWREAVWQEQEASAARDLADRKRHEAERQEQETGRARDLADRERAKADAINQFLIEDVLKAARPDKLGRQVTLKQALDNAEPKIATTFAGKPEVEASLRRTLGATYWKLGFYAQAEPQLRKALALFQRALPADHPETLMAVNNLGMILDEQGKTSEAEPLFRKALDGFRKVRGPHHLDTLTAMHNLAALLFSENKLADAQPLMAEVLDECRRQHGPDSRHTLEAQNNLAMLLRRRGKWSEAEPLCRDSYSRCRRVLGSNDELSLAATNNLAAVLVDLDKPAEAEPIFRQLAELCRQVLGPEHPNRLQVLFSLARALQDQAKGVEAEEICRQLLMLRRKQLPQANPVTALTLALLGEIVLGSGKADEAEKHMQEALTIQRKVLPKGHTQTAATESVLGACLSARGQHQQAETLLLASWTVLAGDPGLSPARKRVALNRIVRLYQAWGQPNKAREWAKKSVDP